MTPLELGGIEPTADAVLEPETRADALPFKKRRACPDCATPMTPLRIGRLEAWVERCASCDGAWVEVADAKSLALVARGQKRQDAWSSMSASERSEIAKDLAQAEVPKEELPVEAMSAGQVAKAVVGVPLLTGLEGAQAPIFTSMSVVLVACGFLGALLLPETFGFEALAYWPGRDTPLGVFPAVFAHGGWTHFLGNVLSLFLFGDAVERRAPRWLVPAAVFGVGAASIGIDSFFSTAEAIGGASGGVFALMGLTAVLQRRGRWLVPVTLPFIGLRKGLNPFVAIRVPLPIAMVVYVAFDVFVASDQNSGIAWVAHAAGFMVGLVGGVIVARQAKDTSPG